MTADSTVEHSLAYGLQFRSALAQMSETELACLLDMIEILEADFRVIPLLKGEAVEAGALAQILLQMWNNEIDQFLLDEQATNTSDNEGEWVGPTEDSQQDEDWENFEDTG